ncbi:MAG TPA: sugar nucleotide-binding protein [Verrucomicrobiota bacterium]|nr:sugar nucleotide-binding protein [Verrucomicrobiota bacterium]
MILLLGASGYVGQAFAQALLERSWEFEPISRRDHDYTRFDLLVDLIRRRKPEFLINAAGYTGKPNVDGCETARADTLQGNTLFPLTVAHACQAAGIPWGHVSSGCIYTGAKILENGVERVEPDLMRPDVREWREAHPETVRGFVETDEPNFSFRRPPCSFYSGTKALAEEAIAGVGRSYLWRLRIPFDEHDNPRNYLTKIQRYARVYENVNSISHLGDFVGACLGLWERRAPFGAYNVTNPGWITTRQVVEMIRRILRLDRTFDFWADDQEFYRLGAKTPRSNCVLDASKLIAAGVSMRPVGAALEAALGNWKPS